MIEQLFTNFSFRALWTPELIVVLAIVTAIYFLLIGKWREKFVGAEPVATRQKVYFILGMIALYFGWGSPLYIAGHLMISFHMTQMVMAYIIAVPLLLLGIPKWFYRAIINKVEGTIIGKLGRVFFNPLMGVLLFNGFFSIYHLPNVFDFLMQNVVMHSLYEMLLLVTSALMWWFMLAPLPGKEQLSHLRRIGYIFANGVLITPACALIIFAGTPVYAVYTDPATWATVMAYCLPGGSNIPFELFGANGSFAIMEPVHDQQLAGVIMKIMQEITYGITIGYVFKQWITREKQTEGKGPSISDIPATHTMKN